jgi:putative DNA primase/helicase
VRLDEAIAATGMTPPRNISAGRWLRFPGIGKGKANRAGWCRVITPTLAIFGDWSSGFTETWRDDSHRDDENTKRLLEEARQRERRFAAEQREKQSAVALEAEQLVRKAMIHGHPYLVRKGFPDRSTLVCDGKIVIPIRDVDDYKTVISAQLIDENGEKRFLTGGRTRGGIHRLGVMRADRIVLCEGYATGLSLHLALMRLSDHGVIVCFSARNLELVASRFPNAIVCADNDASKTGEECAKRTGLRWIMPARVGDDFNDVMMKDGMYSLVATLREAFASG